MEENNYWARLLRRRMSRRAALATGAAAALGTASLVLVGCQEDKEEPAASASPAPSLTPSAEGEPKYGGVLRLGRATEVGDGLDPHTDLLALDICAKLYSYLYLLSSDTQEAIPYLATSVETPDQLTFIFPLRRGVHFHDIAPVRGREVTAEDVLYSFRRRSTSLTVPDRRFPLAVDKMETPDPYTFKLTMKRPFAPAWEEMANPTWAIVPREAVDHFGALHQKTVGSGPFMLESFAGAERIRIRKNPNFFVPGRPYLDGQEYIVILDNSSLLAAFRTKQHDVNGAYLDKPLADSLSKEKDVVIVAVPNLLYPLLSLKVDRPPFKDIRVREAVDLAIDREEMIQKLGFGEGNFNGAIAWSQKEWALPQEELRQFFRPDLQRAKQLLAEAGYPDGLNLTIKAQNIPGPGIVHDLALLLKEQLARAGINVGLEFIELNTWIVNVFLAGNFDMAFGIQLPYSEPDRPLSFYHSLGVSGFGNPTGYRNAEIDQLIEKQQSTFDRRQRQEIIWEVQRKILAEHGPHISLVTGLARQAWWNYVKGMQATPAGTEIFNWNIWLDRPA